MKRFAMLVAVLLVGSVATAQDDASKKDLHAMEGSWSITALEMGGKKISDTENKKANVKLVVKDGKYAVHFGDKVFATGTIKLDASKNPKQIDAVAADGSNKDKAMLGVYQVEGDTMKVCFAEPGKDRPTGFTTTKDNGQMLFNYKRIKN